MTSFKVISSLNIKFNSKYIMKRKIMRAVYLKRYNIDLAEAIRSLEVIEKPIPTSGKGQVLIRIEASPCNPADLSFLQGAYGVKKSLPVVPGLEGAGTVVSADDDQLANSLLNKRVCFAANNKLDGTWAEYAIADAISCFPLRQDIPSEQAAGMLVNPYTAIGLLETAKQFGSKAIIQTAAAGQLGRMLLILTKQQNIPVINIVRKDSQVDLLKKRGEKYVLNSTSNRFIIELRSLARELQATTTIDAVAGGLAGTIIKAMPDRSQFVVYGALSGKAVANVDPRDIIFSRKSIRGFILWEWLEKTTPSKLDEITAKLQSLFAKGELKTEVQRKIKLEEVVEGVNQYRNNMTGGKVIFLPQEK